MSGNGITGLRVLVVDDEAPARDELVYLLRKQPGIESVHEAADGVEALGLIASLRPHVLLLDIQMPLLDGLALAQTLLAWPEGRPQIIFVTAYDNYAVPAFEVNAIDYLLKPVQASRLAGAIARLRSRIQPPCPSSEELEGAMRQMGREVALTRLPVEHGGRILLLDRKEILYVTTEEGETVIRAAGQRYTSRFSLQELERRLGPPFRRVHKAYVVDLSRVVEVIPWFHGNYSLVLNDTERTQVPVGRQNVREIREILGLKSTS